MKRPYGYLPLGWAQRLKGERKACLEWELKNVHCFPEKCVLRGDDKDEDDDDDDDVEDDDDDDEREYLVVCLSINIRISE